MPGLWARRSEYANWLTPTATFAGANINKQLTPAGGSEPLAASKTILLVNGSLKADRRFSNGLTPAEHYKAVAEVIGYIMKLKRAVTRN